MRAFFGSRPNALTFLLPLKGKKKIRTTYAHTQNNKNSQNNENMKRAAVNHQELDAARQDADRDDNVIYRAFCADVDGLVGHDRCRSRIEQQYESYGWIDTSANTILNDQAFPRAAGDRELLEMGLPRAHEDNELANAIRAEVERRTLRTMKEKLYAHFATGHYTATPYEIVDRLTSELPQSVKEPVRLEFFQILPLKHKIEFLYRARRGELLDVTAYDPLPLQMGDVVAPYEPSCGRWRTSLRPLKKVRYTA